MNRIEWGNPYSHEEHSRESLPQSEWISEGVDSCDWCGRGRDEGIKTLYNYDDTKGWFCGKSCWEDYNT